MVPIERMAYQDLGIGTLTQVLGKINPFLHYEFIYIQNKVRD
jgi:hypothetical protein